MNNSTEILTAERLLAESGVKNDKVLAAFTILNNYSDLVTHGTGTKETHKLATAESSDTLLLYITPVLDRMHMIEPQTPVGYEFNEDEEKNLTLTLSIGPRKFIAETDSYAANGLLYRCRPLLEAYIQANKGSDGCVSCGAGPKEICHATCPVLEAELILTSMDKLL